MFFYVSFLFLCVSFLFLCVRVFLFLCASFCFCVCLFWVGAYLGGWVHLFGFFCVFLGDWFMCHFGNVFSGMSFWEFCVSFGGCLFVVFCVAFGVVSFWGVSFWGGLCVFLGGIVLFVCLYEPACWFLNVNKCVRHVLKLSRIVANLGWVVSSCSHSKCFRNNG